jgi:formylglycine-generating enzyme required for sulfatase activity
MVISVKKRTIHIAVAVLISLAVAGGAAAKGMGGFSFGQPEKKEKKETKEDILEQRKKRRPAKMQDVLWDKATQGMVRIFCKPSANLYVDGELQKDPKGKRSRSEKFAVALSVGSHVIKLEREGFEPQERQITIEAGKPYSMNFTLMRKGLKRGEMVFIPAGEFWMGIDKYDLKWIVQKIGGEKRFHRNESPRRKEQVAAFYMDKYEVTNAQYKKFVEATGREVLPDDWENGTYPPGKADFPVTYVTWYDANDYCKWAGKRLPTEKEWEKAARWGPDKKMGQDDSTLYPWGNRFNRNNANTASGSRDHTTITGQYEKGKSAYGIYDMSGNVKEWTADWYQDYPGSTYKDEFAAGEEVKVARGGSFLERPYECLATCRYKYSPGTAYDDLGFRCAKDAK